MTIILIGVALYTILGGMFSVLVTDYIQFVVMGIGLLTLVFLFTVDFGWEGYTRTVEQNIGYAGFNPFMSGQYGLDRIVLDILLAFATVLTWQTIISRVLSAKDASTGRKIYMGTSPFFLVRFVVPVIFGIAALHFFGPGTYSNSAILAMPNLIAIVVPVGLMGIIVAAMLAADMSTNSSYMLAWSSVIYNDIMKPFHRNKWPEKKGILWNRILVALIGLFLLLYGLWYPLQGDLWVYLQVTGTIYLSSMSVLLIAACYWTKANSWGAIAAITVGCLIPVSYLVMEQVDSTHALAASIGPYKVGIVTYLMASLAMIGGSIIKNKLIKPE